MLKRVFDLGVRASPALKRALVQRLYDTISTLDRDADLPLMNYGYASLNGDRAPALRPEDEKHRWSIQLYHHVASAVELAGREVLEVGSGRGGGAAYVARAFRPKSLLGVDRCRKAVEFSARTYAVEGLSFRHGDAEALPVADGSFDVVMNVESSHGYGSLARFLAEVRRVLRPGGHFLYTDHRNRYELEGWRAQLRASGLVLLEEEEITAQVVRALELDHDRKAALIEGKCPWWLRDALREFGATRGSRAFERFRTREVRYLNFVFQKPAGGDEADRGASASGSGAGALGGALGRDPLFRAEVEIRVHRDPELALQPGDGRRLERDHVAHAVHTAMIHPLFLVIRIARRVAFVVHGQIKPAIEESSVIGSAPLPRPTHVAR